MMQTTTQQTVVRVSTQMVTISRRNPSGWTENAFSIPVRQIIHSSGTTLMADSDDDNDGYWILTELYV